MPRQPHSAEAVARPNRPGGVLAGVRFPAPAYAYLVIALVGAGFTVGTSTPPFVSQWRRAAAVRGNLRASGTARDRVAFGSVL